ncbi:hypothetical protein [Paenibacillus oryzae]|uniref:hypothetical protein n=1 Tax=Paenibacillus oryzae TaxID=1844972 RepID=UPI0012EA369E|nr:hypothetical protein [Paenibacillus oryzae]
MMLINVERSENTDSNDKNVNWGIAFVIRQKTRGIVIFMVQKSYIVSSGDASFLPLMAYLLENLKLCGRRHSLRPDMTAESRGGYEGCAISPGFISWEKSE